MSFDMPDSKKVVDDGAMDSHHLILSNHFKRHKDIVWWCCVTHPKDYVE